MRYDVGYNNNDIIIHNFRREKKKKKKTKVESRSDEVISAAAALVSRRLLGSIHTDNQTLSILSIHFFFCVHAGLEELGW